MKTLICTILLVAGICLSHISNAQEQPRSQRLNFTVTNLYNPNNQDKWSTNGNGPIEYSFTYLMQLTNRSRYFEYGVFGGLSDSPFLRWNFGLMSQFYPVMKLKTLDKIKLLRYFEPYLRAEFHTYKFRGPQYFTTGKLWRNSVYKMGVGVGTNFRLSKMFAINYEYIYNTSNENRIGLNYLFGL